jgi:ankyrin repeat protein
MRPSEDSTFLHIASLIGLRTVVQLLLEQDMGADEVDGSCNTALHCAVRCGHTERCAEECQSTDLFRDSMDIIASHTPFSFDKHLFFDTIQVRQCFFIIFYH